MRGIHINLYNCCLRQEGQEIPEIIKRPYWQWGRDEMVAALKDARNALRETIEGRLSIKSLEIEGQRLNDVPIRSNMRTWAYIGQQVGDDAICEACLAGCYYITEVINKQGFYPFDTFAGVSSDPRRSQNILGFLDSLRHWEPLDAAGKKGYLYPEEPEVIEELRRLGLRFALPWDKPYEYDPDDPQMVLEMLDDILEPIDKAPSPN